MATPDPIHPGEHLAEMLDELGITQYRLAKTIGVPQVRVQQIVRGRRAVTPDSALRIGRALGMTPEFWLNLQRMYDLDVARATTDLSGVSALHGVEAGDEDAFAAYQPDRAPAAALADPEPDEPYGSSRKGG
jgi:addiction module HigA family antidote